VRQAENWAESGRLASVADHDLDGNRSVRKIPVAVACAGKAMIARCISQIRT